MLASGRGRGQSFFEMLRIKLHPREQHLTCSNENNINDQYSKNLSLQRKNMLTKKEDAIKEQK
jgi:hypothetical protein